MQVNHLHYELNHFSHECWIYVIKNLGRPKMYMIPWIKTLATTFTTLVLMGLANLKIVITHVASGTHLKSSNLFGMNLKLADMLSISK